MVYNYIRMGEYYYFFYFFAPPSRVQLQLQLQLPWNARRRWSPAGGWAWGDLPVDQANICSQKIFQKILEKHLFLCYNHVRGGKGLALYETPGCVVFSLYNIYSKKIFRKTFQKRLQFSFCFDIIVLSMRGSRKNEKK